MTNKEAIKMAKADLECMERDISGQDEMCNSHKCDECSLNYEKGNMGEQKEWLRMAIQALEQTQWIPVSEPPKESLNSVIGWDGFRERCVFVQYIDGYFQITGKAESFDIKAWMPLPPSYKESEDEK